MKVLRKDVLFCVLVFSFLQNIAFGQLSSKNGNTYTTEISVKFKIKAFDEMDTNGLAKRQDLKSGLKSVNDFIQEYGEVKFRKTFADASWGDTIRYNRQGKTVKVPDLSQIYSITFPEPVKMWETIYAW